MSVAQQTIQAFLSGTHNLLPNEVIPQDAASDSLNWLTRDGHIELARGRRAVGGFGAAGKNYGEHTAFRADGTPVRFRKVGTKIQSMVPSVSETWTDVITGLTESADYTFANYQSLAGAFCYIFGVDGIYKVATANPTSYSSMYDPAKNFKGYGLIDRARTILWGREQDPTGLYGSYIDAQNGDVYTSVSGEATSSLGGTLAFKAGGATRTCFGVQITLTVSGEVYTDDFNGNLVGNMGGTGTINYTTGAYTLSNAGVGTAAYQWEDSNNEGVTDFSHDEPRVAGQGFMVRQDAGGDAIVVVLALDGNYFSLKKNSCYRFVLDAEDENPLNEIFRTDIGVPSLRSATGTGAGILFMNTANPTRPRFTIIQRNPLGDNFDANDLFPQYDFSLFNYSDCLVDTWDKYAIVACKSDSDENNRLLLCDVLAKTVDATYYGIRASCKVNGILNGGDPVSLSTYELFTGFDDLGNSLTPNYWDSKGETFGDEVLKKERFVRYKGKIDPNQQIGVYIQLDDGDFALIGTIRGDGSYVDYNSSYAIGTVMVGGATVGGDDIVSVYQYLIQLKIKVAKFRKRVIRFMALGVGFASVEQATDYDILTYEGKLPPRYRSKQNVSLDGTETDLANPQF